MKILYQLSDNFELLSYCRHLKMLTSFLYLFNPMQALGNMKDGWQSNTDFQEVWTRKNKERYLNPECQQGEYRRRKLETSQENLEVK